MFEKFDIFDYTVKINLFVVYFESIMLGKKCYSNLLVRIVMIVLNYSFWDTFSLVYYP